MTRPAATALLAFVVMVATSCTATAPTETEQSAQDAGTRTCETTMVDAAVPGPDDGLGTGSAVFIGTGRGLHDELNWSDAGYAIEKIPISPAASSSPGLVVITTPDPDLARLAYGGEGAPALGFDQFEDFPSQATLERCDFQAAYSGAIIVREPHCVEVVVTEGETTSSVNLPLGGTSCG